MKVPKIFCIGFHKSAGTSLAEALEMLTGTKVFGPVGIMRPDIALTYRKLVWEVIDDYEIFRDNPFPLMFKELDEARPGSKFILTRRKPEAWIKSVLRHFGGDSTPMREFIYGVGDPRGHEDVYLERYNRHNADVIEYFKGRTDLLVLDLDQGDGWDKLCAFLDKPHPGVPFPERNRAEERESNAPRYISLFLPYGKGRTSPDDP